MVQIIPREKSSGDRIAQAFAELSGNLSQSISQELMGRQERRQLGSLAGEDLSNVRNPDMLRMAFQSAMQQKNQQQQAAQEMQSGLLDYNTIEKYAGKDVADFYQAAPVGGKTKIVDAVLKSIERGEKFGNKLKEGVSPDNLEESLPSKKGELPEYKLNTQGMTPKEVVDFKAALRKENTPIWKETIDNLANYKELDTDISILEKLNEKKNLPEGLEKLLIDPETGAPYPLGTIIKTPNKDVQQWGKTLARQATKAQTAFPGRVTNFDLAAYMRQFPGLFNTYDGRKVILEQMKLSNKAHLLMSQSMDKVYSKHKLSGITPEDAFEQARSMVEEKLEQIDQQLISLAEEGEILSSEGEKLTGRMVDVIGDDGQLYEVDESEVEQLPPGFRIK